MGEMNGKKKGTPAKSRLSLDGGLRSSKTTTPAKMPNSEKKVKSTKKFGHGRGTDEEEKRSEPKHGLDHKNDVEESAEDVLFLETEKIRNGLSQRDIQTALQDEGPEFLNVLTELKSSIAEIRQQLRPVIDKVDVNQLPTQAGVSYLELKSQLLLSYTTALSFYLYHKLHPLSIVNHPEHSLSMAEQAIESLVQVRTLIDKLRPLDTKLKYQMDKLLKAPSQAAPTPQRAVGDGLGFKPNPDALLAGEGGMMPAEKGEQREADEGEEEEGGKKDGIYRPPRITAMHFDDDKESKAARDRRKRALKASKSDIVQALREEFDDTPTEAPNIGASVGAIERDEEEEHRRQFEEDNMLRLTVTKKDKKRLKEKERKAMREDDFDDFRDLDLSNNREMSRETESLLKKRSVKDMLGGSDDGPQRAGFKFQRGGKGAGKGGGNRKGGGRR